MRTDDEKRAARHAALSVRRWAMLHPSMPLWVTDDMGAFIESEFPPVVRVVPNIVRVESATIPGYAPGPYEFAVFDRVPHWRIMMRNGNPSTQWTVFDVSVHVLPPQVLVAVAEVLTNPLKHEPDDGE